MATSSAAARPNPNPGQSIGTLSGAAITRRILATTRIYLALAPQGRRPSPAPAFAPTHLREHGGEFVDPPQYRFGAGFGAGFGAVCKARCAP